MLRFKRTFSTLLQPFGIAALLVLVSPVAPVAYAGELAIVQTSISAPQGQGGRGESYRIYAGTFEAKDSEIWATWLKKQLARPDGKPSYLQVVPMVEDQARSPQSLNPRALTDLGKKVVRKVNGAVLAPAFKVPDRFMSWMKKGDNGTRLTFAVIATVVDGVVNGGGLFYYQGSTPEAALAVGATIAALSGSWSFTTPEIAKFLNGDPSLVDRILKKKHSLPHELGKWGEGLFKWGIIQYAYLGAISAVSAHMGVAHFDTLGDWALTNFWTAGLITIGQGLFDFSLSVELHRSLRDPDPARQRKVLIQSYAMGTAAASIATMGGLASTMGLEFGEYTIYGLLGAGIVNLARIEKSEVLKFVNQFRTRCWTLLKAPVAPPVRLNREADAMGSE